MPGATMTTVTSILKEVYEGRIQTQYNNELVAIKRLENSSEGVIDTVGGKYVTFPLKVKRNAGISYRGERVQLAPVGQQGYAAVTVPLRYGYGRFEVTGQVMELAEANYQAFSSAMDGEMDGLKDDLRKDSCRISYGAVANGAVAYTTGTGASANQVVVNPQYLQEGMIVDLMNPTGPAVITAGVTVNAINETTKTVTLSSSVTPVAGSYFVRTGNAGQEPTGLTQIFAATGALHGLDPATQPVWAGNLINNGAAPGTPIALSEAKMIQACDTARRKGGKTSAIFTSLGVRRAYFTLLTQQRRYTDTKSYPGGFQGLPFNYGTEIPVVEDVDAPPNKMWFADESKIKVYRKRAWHFADADGNILKWVRDYDTWEGMMRQYWEIGTSQRNAHCLYDDILEG